jgi:protein-arginine kinase activator protein McsA
MKLSLVHFFTLYVTVFLAVLLIAWLFFLRTRRRSQLDARRIFICQSCQSSFAECVPYQRPRCPHCGAIYEDKVVKEQSDEERGSDVIAEPVHKRFT